VVLKNAPAVTIADMKFPNAPYSLKMACGENPTREYGSHGRAPVTLGGEIAMVRSGFLAASAYARERSAYEDKLKRGEKADPPKRELQAEAIADVLQGKTRLAIHCYRAENMAVILQVAHEFGFKVAAFHHATEAFKILPLLNANDTCVFTWGPDWGGFKLEAYDHSDLTPAMVSRSGGCVAITSDSIQTGQHLNIDAARSMAAGNEEGLAIDAREAIRWITINPAKALGISDQTGSLEAGKMADVVLWNQNPFSVYAYPELVLLDGGEVYRRGDPRYRAPTDLELGQTGQEGGAR
jgi:imidazolonepropionase-like amidohydrolase